MEAPQPFLRYLPIGPICLLGLLLLAGCSSGSDDSWEPTAEEWTTPEPEPLPEVPISFGGSEGAGEEVNMVKGDRTGATTRAGVPLSDKGVTAFQVWGYKNMSDGLQTVFPGYAVEWTNNTAGTTTTNSSNWEYLLPSKPAQLIKYWDWSAVAYRFYAVTGWGGAPPEPPAVYEANKAYGANGVSDTYEVSMLTDATSTVAMNQTPYFSHLWYSTGQLPEYADKQFGKPVVLEFVKPYARVRFLFKYAFPREGIVLSNKSFKPSDGSAIARKGTVTVTYPLTGVDITESFSATGDTSSGALEALEALEDFDVDYDPEDDSKDYVTLSSGEMTEDGWYIVVPNTAQGSYTLSVNINGAVEAKHAAVPAEFMQWKPGFSYTYVFKILDQGGVEIDLVESSVVPWVNENAVHEVYNW